MSVFMFKRSRPELSLANPMILDLSSRNSVITRNDLGPPPPVRNIRTKELYVRESPEFGD
jgi:hypothetical protein